MHGRPVQPALGGSSPSHPNRWRILGVLVLALLVTSIDHTIITVALPQLVGDLDASSAQLQWIVAAYIVVFAGLLLTAGSLGDRFDRRRALATGLLTFMAGSIAAALAASTTAIIVGRGVMGVDGALIMPHDAVDPRQLVRRAARAGQGDRRVDRSQRRRDRPRTHRRRAGDAQLLVVVGVLDQRAAPRHRVRRHPAPRPRVGPSWWLTSMAAPTLSVTATRRLSGRRGGDEGGAGDQRGVAEGELQVLRLEEDGAGNVAPASAATMTLVSVELGAELAVLARDAFSDWDEAGDDVDDAIEMVEEGAMPPDRYTMIHRDARLTDAEAQALVVALRALERAHEDDEDDDD